jgi:hypothetical protein
LIHCSVVGGHPAGRYGHSHAGCSNSPDQGGPDLVPLSSGLSLLGSKDRDRPPGSPRSSLSIIGLPASTDPYYQPSTRPSKTVPISRYPLCCCIYSLCAAGGSVNRLGLFPPRSLRGPSRVRERRQRIPGRCQARYALPSRLSQRSVTPMHSCDPASGTPVQLSGRPVSRSPGVTAPTRDLRGLPVCCGQPR